MSEAKVLNQDEEIREEEDQLQEVAVFDDASAEYLLKRIREANAQYEKMEAWFDLQKSKAKEIRDNTVAWAERGLRAYLDMVPAKKSKTQISYELPGGKLVLKQQEPKYENPDEEATVKWLKASGNAEYVKVKETPNWADMKKDMKVKVVGDTVCTEDGEVIPGMKATAREPKFTVTLNEKIK